MIIDLSNFLDDSNVHFNFKGELEGLESELKEKNINLVGPVEYDGSIFKTYGSNYMDLKIEFSYKDSCNRCLESSTHKVETRLSGKLVEGKKKDEEIEDKEVELHGEDHDYDETFYYERDRLNLKDYILNQVILSLPMKSLCDDDCKGLCDLCGVNLNKETCDCTHDEIDPRLEKLKDFFPKK